MARGVSGLADIFTELRGELLRFLHARTGSASEAEDVLQDIWVRVQSASSGPIGNPRAYFYRIAQNLMLDRIRDRRRREQRERDWADSQQQGGTADPADARPNAEQQMIEDEDVAALAAAIAALPPAAGTAFRLHKLDGLSHAQVASRLGISRSGVEKHIAIAMAHLRRALKTEE